MRNFSSKVLLRTSRLASARSTSFSRACSTSSSQETATTSADDTSKFDFDGIMSAVQPIFSEYLSDEFAKSARVSPLGGWEDVEERLSIDQLLAEDGLSNEEIVGEVRSILDNSFKTHAPLSCDKLFVGSAPVPQMASLLLAVMNNNGHIFQAGPSVSAIESAVLRALCGEFFQNLPSDELAKTGGIFVPGGSYANLMAVRCARERAFPDIKTKGFAVFEGTTPKIYVTGQKHYSMMTNASLLGLGSDNVVMLKTHANGQIDLDNLRVELENARRPSSQITPLMVSTLAGSTVLGSFDNFDAVHAVCREFDVPMHVDACWGGTAIFSRRAEMRERFSGIEKADWIAFDGHKQLEVPLLCTALLTRDDGELARVCLPVGAEYLYHGAQVRLDHGKKTMQCSRSADAVKLYLYMLSEGRRGLAAKVDRSIENARVLYDMVSGDDDFVAVVPNGEPPHYCNVTFWCVRSPRVSKFRKLLLQWRDSEYSFESEAEKAPEFKAMIAALSEETKLIHGRIKAGGEMLIDYAPLNSHELPCFLRPVTPNPKLNKDLVRRMVELIKEAADVEE